MPPHSAPRRCILCAAAGLAVPANWRSAICDDHRAALAASGRAWCARGRHVVAAAEYARASSCCLACNRARQRTRRVPAGYLTLRACAARCHVSRSTIGYWLARGWPVATITVDGVRYVPDLPHYPPGPADTRAGRRRRPELDVCRGCGAPIDNPSSHPRYCPPCRKARQATQARRRSGQWAMAE